MKNGIHNTGLIEPPLRETYPGSSIILVVIIVLSIAFLIPGGGGKWMLIILSLLILAAVSGKYVYAVHVSMLALLLFLPAFFVPDLKLWPFNILVPLITYGLAVSFIPGLRRSAGWLKRGKTDLKVFRIVIAAAFLSAIALVGWVIIVRPDIEHHIAQLPELPLWVYPFAGVGFAVLNAAMEETVFRGVVMETLDSALGAGSLSVFIQAIPFAALHYLSGFPNGVSGLIMALIYGIILGTIRRISKGMLAPFVTHVAADITIFSILAFILLSS